MHTQLSQSSRMFRSVQVIVRFILRMVVLLGFAFIARAGFAAAFAMLLWMSAILCAAVATFKRERPFADVLNHWDEAAAYIGLCCLAEATGGAT